MKPNPARYNLRVAAGKTAYERGAPPFSRPDGIGLWIIQYTLEGRGRLESSNGAFSVEPHHALLFAPDTPHRYHADSSKPWTHYWAAFELRSGWQELVAWPKIARGISRIDISDPRMHALICRGFERVIEFDRGTWQRKDALTISAIESLLLMCDEVRLQSLPVDERLRKALEYVALNFAHRMTIARLAKHCATSPSRLFQLFKGTLGTTPMAYVEEWRINRARDLLESTALPVSSVAHAVGFEDPFYFTRIFKRRTGQSPRAFRSAARARG